MTLIATLRPSSGCSARYTTPMPPRPSTPSIRYPAKIVPILIAAAISPRELRPYRRRAGRRCGRAPRNRSVRLSQAFFAQLIKRLGPLLQVTESHPVQYPRGLGELDVAVVDDLDQVSPRIAEVEEPSPGDLHPGLLECSADSGLVIDHQAEVPGSVGSAGIDLRKRHELIAHVDEGHPRHAIDALDREDPSVELERFVDVPHLQGDMIDPHEAWPLAQDALSSDMPSASRTSGADGAMSGARRASRSRQPECISMALRTRSVPPRMSPPCASASP